MLKFTRIVSGIFLGLALAATISAQDEEKLTVSTDLVSLNVTVADSHGRFVTNLGKNQFEVFDNGVRQQLVHFSTGETPLSMGIVYDMHGSTTERSSAALRALKKFVASLPASDDFFLLIFNERGSAVVGFVPTAEQICSHLEFVSPKGANSLYDAVYLAATKIRQSTNQKKALLIISDGQDHSSRHSYKELRWRVSEFGVQVYGVGIADPQSEAAVGYGRWMFEDLTRRGGRRTLLENADSGFGHVILEELARTSGGAAYFPQAEGELELFGICAQIALEVRRQYTIGYYPTNMSSETKHHKIRVRVSPPSDAGRLYLSYRQGYDLPNR